MKVLAKYNDGQLYGEDFSLGGGPVLATYHAGTLWEVLICEACEKVTVRLLTYDERFDETADEYKTIYPEAGRKLHGLPEQISVAYEAALKVRSVDSNGYALLLRRLLELVCRDQQAKGANLFEALQDLAKRNILPQQLIDVANFIRSFGNVAAHALTGDVEEADVPLLDSLSAAVLEYVYVAPLLVSQARDRVAKLGTLTARPSRKNKQ